MCLIDLDESLFLVAFDLIQETVLSPVELRNGLIVGLHGLASIAEHLSLDLPLMPLHLLHKLRLFGFGDSLSVVLRLREVGGAHKTLLRPFCLVLRLA